DKSLCLHAKVMVFDDDRVFVGSANLDPRSLRINTEMGLLVVSEELNAAVRTAFDPDFAERNAWRLQFDADGKVVWISDDTVLRSQPAASWMQRIEDWFFAHLPIEDKM
ncbi:MAG TPA: phospholipase D-like domain-containing protein, partial [Woeseiaceae bacterium]|nr:phospholipase D-like domain-containing protein [Woeseiaceae bacterium]